MSIHVVMYCQYIGLLLNVLTFAMLSFIYCINFYTYYLLAFLLFELFHLLKFFFPAFTLCHVTFENKMVCFYNLLFHLLFLGGKGKIFVFKGSRQGAIGKPLYQIIPCKKNPACRPV